VSGHLVWSARTPRALPGRRSPLAVMLARAEPRHATASNRPGSCGVRVARDDGWAAAVANDDTLIDRDALSKMADRLAASNESPVKNRDYPGLRCQARWSDGARMYRSTRSKSLSQASNRRKL
jgi:hypothetical protein